MSAVVAHEAGAQRIHGKVLEPSIESGANLQATVVECAFAIFRVKDAPYFFDEIIRVHSLNAKRPHLGHERLGYRGSGLLIRDVAVFRHLPDHPIAAIKGSGLVETRIVIAGRLRQCRQKGRLGDIQLVE